VSVAGGVVTFSATAGGTYSFTYQAVDAAGAASANAATVTVQVAAAETLAIARAEWDRGRLRANGTLSPAAIQTITLQFVNSTGAVVGSAGTATTDAAGLWARSASVSLPAGATVLRATSPNGTVINRALSIRR
jgi:hypothetical protein